MFPSEQERALRARRHKLTAHLTQIEHDLDKPPPKDWEDRSSERQGDEVLEQLGLTELAEVNRIDAALARIADGTYGQCQKCGEDISAERLAVLPDTPFCKSCAK